MNTVGKKDRLGEAIRCVVSVSMLTEGWDANTLTQVHVEMAARANRAVNSNLILRNWLIDLYIAEYEQMGAPVTARDCWTNSPAAWATPASPGPRRGSFVDTDCSTWRTPEFGRRCLPN